MTEIVDRCRELYALAKEIYNAELDRFDKIDNKAAKYLSSLTFVIGILGLFGKWLITEALPPSSLIEWFVVMFALATLASLILSWLSLFHVLRLRKVMILPISDETISLFKINNLATALYTMTKGLKKAHQTNRKTVNEKVKWLNLAYKIMIVSGILLMLLMSTLTLHTLSPSEVQEDGQNKRRTEMTDDDKEKQNLDEDSQLKDDAEPPQFDAVDAVEGLEVTDEVEPPGFKHSKKEEVKEDVKPPQFDVVDAVEGLEVTDEVEPPGFKHSKKEEVKEDVKPPDFESAQ